MSRAAVYLAAAALVYQALALPLYRVDLVEPLFPDLTVAAVAPSFPLLAVLYSALYSRARGALLLAALCGFAVEGLSMDPWGSHSLGYLVAAGLLRMQAGEGWAESALPRAVLATVGVAAAVLVRSAVLAVARWSGAAETGLPGAGSLAFEVLYNGGIALALYPLLDLFRDRLVPVSHRKLMGWSPR